MNWFGRHKVDETKDQEISSNQSLPQFKGVKVLVVDDSRTQLYAMEKLLKSVGIETLTAENGKQGILMARHKKPDLILMDIVMPEINGFQATRYLSRHTDTAHIPIIIISGSNQESDKAWGLKLGAREFMHKPVDKDELFEKMTRLLHESAQQADQMQSLVRAV
jgi:twitching motility two-component system response regulator PilH